MSEEPKQNRVKIVSHRKRTVFKIGNNSTEDEGEEEEPEEVAGLAEETVAEAAVEIEAPLPPEEPELPEEPEEPVGDYDLSGIGAKYRIVDDI